MKTITLETAKLLKQAGWNKKTENRIAEFADGSYGRYNGGTYKGVYPDPTTDELLEEFPDFLCIEVPYDCDNGSSRTAKPKHNPYFEMEKEGNEYCFMYKCTTCDKYLEHNKHENPAEALVLLWLKLRQKGLI